jgi:hypothetical protein
VRELTARADAALRAVTANFDTWDDARLVEFAEAVHAAETAADPAASGTGPTPERLARWRAGAEAVRRLRAGPDGSGDAAAVAEADALARDLRAHRRLLGVLRMTPADLHERTDLGTAAWWALRRVPLAAGGAVAALGAALAWPAYRAVGVVAGRMPGADATDVRATSKFLVGALVFLVWTVALAVVAGLVAGRAGGAGWGLVAAAVTLVAAPALALHTLRTAEGWDAARRDARRFLRLRGGGEQVTELRARQRGLAERVAAAVTRAAAAVEPRADDPRPPAQAPPVGGAHPGR